jgi:zinc transporter
MNSPGVPTGLRSVRSGARLSLPTVASSPTSHPDLPGCLWIVRFNGAGRAAPGSASDLERLGAADDGYLWLHMDLTDVRARPFISQIRALSEAAQEALCEPVDHQYLEFSDMTVCGALLDRERALSGPTSQTDYVRFAMGRDYLVTARRRPMSCIEATRIAVDRGAVVESPLALFETMAGFLLEELRDVTGQVSAMFDRAEDFIIDQRSRDARALLGAARRDAVRLTRQVGGLASTLARLEDVEDDAEEQDADFRETGARLTQHIDALKQEMQSLQERARLLQDELNAMLNLETNDRLYILTVVTTLLLPATFVTGFFGMNLKNLPFAEDDAGLAYVSIMCVIASAAVLMMIRRMGLTNPREEESRPGPSETPSRPADSNL